MIRLRDNNHCYVCGKKNPFGLAVDFAIDAEARTIRATFSPTDFHQGYEGLVHGGILSSLLDEAMAKLAYNLGVHAVTAELTVKFKAPAAPGDTLAIVGKLQDSSGKLVLAEASISRGPVVVAEAKGKLLKTGS